MDGEAKPAPDTLSMLLGKYLGEGAEAVGSIFPPSNPYGQAVKNFLLGDIPETAGRLEEGEPYVLMDTRAGRQLIKPEALEVAGFLPVGEVAKGAGLAAKALGAKESSLLGMLGATAYHGSPYKFAPTERNPLGEFDPSKIGTGEGSQRFAHGFYAGEVPRTASSYAAMVAKPGTSRSGSEQFVTDALIKLNALKFTNGDVQELAGLIEKHPSAFAKPEEMLERIKTYSGNNPVGYVYKLDIPDEQIEKMLRWDKPMSEQPESVKKALMPEVDYRGLHTPPMKDSGAPLYDLTGAGQVYPDDVYSSEAYRYYGHGEPAQDRALFSKIQSYKNKPEEKVVIYRAIPKDVYKNLLDSEKPLFNHGDWVTISKDYAKEHGESTLQGDYKIIHKTVRAKNLFTNGDSPYEYGLDLSTSGLHVDDPSISGGEAYERLAKTYGKKNASDWLYEKGIPGAEYLDESSRTSGQGTRNFVLFHPDVAKIIDVEEQKFAKGGAVQIPDHTRIQSIIDDTLHMADGGEVDEPSLTDEARQKAAEALEGLKRMYEDATGKGWSENTLEGLKGTARAYTTDVLGMPVDLLTSLPVAPRESGNPYANAIRNLTESLGETPVGGSDWLAQKLGLYGEGLAHEAGRMFGPGAVKVFAPEKTVAKIFAGERAATADLEAKARAEKMLEEGATFEDIWAKTGWGLGPGGQWRFEIPDWEARTLEDKYSEYLKDKVASREPIYKYVGYLLEHPELKAAYPDVNAMDVILSADKKGGALTQSIPEWAESLKHPLDFTEITAGYDPTTGAADKSVLLHELQHAVQKMESTPYGGSPSEFAQGPMRPKAQNILEDVGQTALGFRPYGVREVTESLHHAIPEDMEEVLKKYGFKDPEDLKRYLEYEDLRRTPFGQYQRLAGEAEARLTQARAGMSPGERRVTYPWNPDYFREQTGIPLEDLIYRYENEGPSELITYHGTPHRFPATERNPLGEFDASKIGTGEGAQAYGHGIYLAESPGVARDYRKKLSDALSYKPEYWDGIPLPDLSVDEYKELEQLKQKIYKNSDQNGPNLNKEESEKWRVLKDKEDARNAAIEAARPKGSLYTVDLPDEMIDRMLDWDKPLGEQPENVQKALQSMVQDVAGSENAKRASRDISRAFNPYNRADLLDEISKRYGWEIRGNTLIKPDGFEIPESAIQNQLKQRQRGKIYESAGDLYRDLAQIQGSDATISAVLRRHGIPGIKYLDSMSRDASEGTRNFVIFPGEEKNLNILERKARGGAVDYDPDKIQRIMASVLE